MEKLSKPMPLRDINPRPVYGVNGLYFAVLLVSSNLNVPIPVPGTLSLPGYTLEYVLASRRFPSLSGVNPTPDTNLIPNVPIPIFFSIP